MLSSCAFSAFFWLFFFKQKTAYEMRISDWSSDVCSSDLPYGRKRALEIATTLALEPEMMLLDEPMAGMGHEDIEKISDLIKRVSANRTVLMVEHNLNVVADRKSTRLNSSH